jgi:hypothetical protein
VGLLARGPARAGSPVRPCRLTAGRVPLRLLQNRVRGRPRNRSRRHGPATPDQCMCPPGGASTSPRHPLPSGAVGAWRRQRKGVGCGAPATLAGSPEVTRALPPQGRTLLGPHGHGSPRGGITPPLSTLCVTSNLLAPAWGPVTRPGLRTWLGIGLHRLAGPSRARATGGGGTARPRAAPVPTSRDWGASPYMPVRDDGLLGGDLSASVSNVVGDSLGVVPPGRLIPKFAGRARCFPSARGARGEIASNATPVGVPRAPPVRTVRVVALTGARTARAPGRAGFATRRGADRRHAEQYTLAIHTTTEKNPLTVPQT